jgi:branched-chain amino acid transport system permease protein
MVAGFVLLAAVPFFPGRYVAVYGTQLIPVLCFAILALGLNVVVGYTGLLHLGIAAFFGIGAYTAGILTTTSFPFGSSFLVVAVAAALAAAAVGVATTAPTLRLRGDYLALVTLGFGLITIYVIRNLDAITDGTKGLTPVSPDLLPGIGDLEFPKSRPGWASSWRKYPYLYYLCLLVLAGVVIFLRNLERSRLGRSWVALREDELAASCMGLNPARLKLSAIALGAGLAGLAGALFAVSQNGTTEPKAYDFNRSMIALCCVILGGLGNRPGVLLGVFLLIGYDQILTPLIDNWLQAQKVNPQGKEYLKVSGWRLFIFGAALILMMRFRPEGLLPAARQKRELHPERAEAAGEAAARMEAEDRSQESGVRNQEDRKQEDRKQEAARNQQAKTGAQQQTKNEEMG